MFILDSDILSLYHHGHERIHNRLAKCATNEVVLTIVSHAEIMKARYEFLLKAANRDEIRTAQSWIEKSLILLRDLEMIGFDEKALKAFEKLDSTRGLGRIGRADKLIASITLANDATLVTRNVRDFSRVPGLRFENWAA